MNTTSSNYSDYERLAAQFQLIQIIRNFFNQRDFLDVMTPPVVNNPGMETHIHPFQLKSVLSKLDLPLYLHTSPEFQMKKLLSDGFHNIFNISYCFRDEPNTPIHRSQFLMLEWYRFNHHYSSIMQDCEALIKYCIEELQVRKIATKTNLQNPIFQRATVQELFYEYLKIDILNFLEIKDLKELINRNFRDVPLPVDANLSWDDCYFLLFLNKIEPIIAKLPYILIYEFPHHLSALSTLKPEDPRVCERFEIYMDGIELCNCFNELRCLSTQKKRFEQQHNEKLALYGYELPEPTVLYEALEKGLPPSSGIAMGMERLLVALTQIENPFWK